MKTKINTLVSSVVYYLCVDAGINVYMVEMMFTNIVKTLKALPEIFMREKYSHS